MDEFALVIKDSTFRYRDRQENAKQDINLQVPVGELLLVATSLFLCLFGFGKFWVPDSLIQLFGG